ncbi:hypothetical protein HYW99_02775 [Candidatus Woesearchaeota archaeon]|nr:hypothetical protein [Candidatus Woesearchaeota archaeon]
MCNALSISTKGRKEEKVKYIAEHLNINLSSILAELPDKSKDALKLILKNGGYIRYGELKEFDDELPYWWNNEQPASSIGILRLYGLLTVGKMPYSGRMFKVALIPKDIKEELEKII